MKKTGTICSSDARIASVTFFFEVIFWTPGATYGGPSAIYVYEYALCYIAIHCRSLAPDGLRTERIPPQPGTSKYRFPAAVIPSCIPLHLSRFLAFRDRFRAGLEVLGRVKRLSHEEE